MSLLYLSLPLMSHVLDIYAAPFPATATTITHVQTLAVAVIIRFAAVSVVVSELLLLPLGSRHFCRMSFPPLGAPVLEPNLRKGQRKVAEDEN